jgi:hypothetical protein
MFRRPSALTGCWIVTARLAQAGMLTLIQAQRRELDFSAHG